MEYIRTLHRTQVAKRLNHFPTVYMQQLWENPKTGDEPSESDAYSTRQLFLPTWCPHLNRYVINKVVRVPTSCFSCTINIFKTRTVQSRWLRANTVNSWIEATPKIENNAVLGVYHGRARQWQLLQIFTGQHSQHTHEKCTWLTENECWW